MTESLTSSVVKGLSKSSEGNSKIVILVCESDVETIVPQAGEGRTRLRSDAGTHRLKYTHIVCRSLDSTVELTV